jgi:hypothetical protein
MHVAHVIAIVLRRVTSARLAGLFHMPMRRKGKCGETMGQIWVWNKLFRTTQV